MKAVPFLGALTMFPFATSTRWWGWLTEWNRRCRDTALRNVTLYSARPYKQGVGKSKLSGLVVTVCATVIALDARNGKLFLFNQGYVFKSYDRTMEGMRFVRN